MRHICNFFVIFATLLLTHCVSLDSQNRASEETILESQKALAVSFLNTGEFQKAMTHLQGLAEKYPNDAEVFNLIGITHISLNNIDTAIYFLNKSISLKPDPATYLNLSSAYIQNKKYVSAIKVLKKQIKNKSLKSYSFPERYYHNLGMAFSKLRKDKAAIKYFKKSLKINPTYILTLVEIGHSYAKLGNQKKAEESYRKSISYCNKCFSNHETLAKFYLSTNQPQKARQVAFNYLNMTDITQKDTVAGKKLLASINNEEKKLRYSQKSNQKRARSK